MDNLEADISAILTFWFGDNPEKPFERAPIWWKSDPAFDETVKTKFSTLHARACEGELENWTRSARSCLAYIILLDQFSRNIYRGTRRAFTQDPASLRACLEGVESGLVKRLSPVEQWFFLMPLQHSENLEIQERSLLHFKALAAGAPEPFRPKLQSAYDFALQHYEIISKFGRFPHRNKILNRESTPEEIAYIDGGGATFGQK